MITDLTCFTLLFNYKAICTRGKQISNMPCLRMSIPYTNYIWKGKPNKQILKYFWLLNKQNQHVWVKEVKPFLHYYICLKSIFNVGCQNQQFLLFMKKLLRL